MKNHVLFFSTLLLITLYGYTQTNIWVKRDTVNGGPKTGCVAFFIDGTGYLGTGYAYNEYKRTFYRYQISNNDWDKIESLGGETGAGLNRNNAVSFVINNKAYVGTGQGDMLYMDDFWEYDPTTKAWTQKASFEGTPRRTAIGFAINGKGYVGTGQDANGFKKDMWMYDPLTNLWTQKNDFGGTARKQAVAVAMGGMAWAGTGDDGVLKNDWWQYNPANDTWTQKNNFGGTPRSGAIAANMGFQGFVGLGYDNSFSYVKDFWEYKISTDTWVKRLDFMGSARASAAAFGSWSSIYVGTGYDGLPTEDFYEYVPILSLEDFSSFAKNSYAFPNPVSSIFSIAIKGYLENCKMTCYTLEGKEIPINIVSQNIFNNETILNLKIDEETKAGTYFYRINSLNGFVSSGKFLVANN
jgi:N-acetylneuraminic acid mutarotase